LVHLGPDAERVVHQVIKNKLCQESPFIYNPDLLDEVLSVMFGYLKGNTRKGYRSGLASFVKFVQNNGIPIMEAFPASDLLLASWGTRACKRLTYSSFKIYWQGVKTYHIRARLSIDGFESAWIKSQMVGLRRLARKKSNLRRWPLTFPQVEKILRALQPSNPQHQLRALVYAVGFLGGPRPSEYLKKFIGQDLTNDAEGLVHPIICWRDVEELGQSPNRTVVIKAHGAKYDPDDKGYRMAFHENKSTVCVITWLNRLRASRKRLGTYGPYMPLFSLDSSPVTVSQAKLWLKRDAVNAGYKAHNYTAYSLRRGLATSLYLLGAKPETIKRMGRWRSDAFARYIELDPISARLWSNKLTAPKAKDFGWLSLEQASEMKLSEVDAFFSTHGKKAKRHKWN